MRKIRDEIYCYILLKSFRGFDRLQFPVDEMIFYFITLIDIAVYNVFFNVAIQSVPVIFIFN